MTQFATSSVDKLIMQADSDVQLLFSFGDPTVSSIQGSAIISEPLLGPSVVFLTSDLECRVCPLQPPPPAQFVADVGATPTRPHPQVKPEAGGFEKVIRDLLTSDEPDPASLPPPKGGKASQEDCFKYFQRSVQGLRNRYLLPQQKVRGALQRRMDILGRQKEQQLRDLVAVRDECGEVMERSEDVRGKMEEAQERGAHLLHRVERLLCKLDARSPILSDAEVNMGKELSELQPKLEAMQHRVEEAKGKLKLGYGESTSAERVTMSRAQNDSICSILEESGRRLLSLKLQIKGLLSAAPS
jgi:hypothetical protein